MPSGGTARRLDIRHLRPDFHHQVSHSAGCLTRSQMALIEPSLAADCCRQGVNGFVIREKCPGHGRRRRKSIISKNMTPPRRSSPSDRRPDAGHGHVVGSIFPFLCRRNASSFYSISRRLRIKRRLLI